MKIYSFNIKNAAKSEIDKWFNAMSKERQESVLTLKVDCKRVSRIAADNLARTAISEFCGISSEQIIFERNKHGKPFAAGLPVFFSISHSGDEVICAVSNKEIGIDIEKIRSVNPRSAERFANEKELKYIAENDNGFFKLWTLKEAYFKCIGTGLGLDIKKVSFDITEENILCSESGFNCSFVKAPSGYICSVCEKET